MFDSTLPTEKKKAYKNFLFLTIFRLLLSYNFLYKVFIFKVSLPYRFVRIYLFVVRLTLSLNVYIRSMTKKLRASCSNHITTI